jgi:hypothetical protein
VLNLENPTSNISGGFHGSISFWALCVFHEEAESNRTCDWNLPNCPNRRKPLNATIFHHEENLAVAVLSNTNSQWPSTIAIEIICTLLSRQPEEFSPPADSVADEPSFAPGPEFVGLWEGFVHTYEGDIPLALEVEESGSIHTTLGEQPRTPLQNVSYQDNLPQFLNAGGRPFLRGWMQGEFETSDVNRGRPYKLWLELKLRENVLNGSLIAFSQREFYIGPLSHWVELRRQSFTTR